MEIKFYRCEICGQIIVKIKDTKVPVICCGQKMTEIIPGTSDGAIEKHVPVYEVKGGKVFVSVGAALHPMLDAHYIEWILLETKFGNQRVQLKPGQEPKATFALLDGDEVVNVYAYCNLHSLYKS